MTMPNDNQAKSYIEAVLARADGATEGPWGREDTTNAHCMITAGVDEDGAHRYVADVYDEEDVPFIAASRQDIPTLAKMSLRAIEALKKVLPWLERETPPQYVGVDREGLPVEYEPTAAEEACGMAAMVLGAALADINALAAALKEPS